MLAKLAQSRNRRSASTSAMLMSPSPTTADYDSSLQKISIQSTSSQTTCSTDSTTTNSSSNMSMQCYHNKDRSQKPWCQHFDDDIYNDLSKIEQCEVLKELNIIDRPTVASPVQYYAPLFTGDDIICTSHIYDDLVKRRKDINYQDDSSNLQPRDYAIKELLVTEENYVETLNELIQEYEKALPLQHDDKCNIFLNVHDLLNLHHEFLLQLREACTNLPGRTQRLAQLFINWQDRFLIYGEYCVRLQYAQAKLSHLRQTDPTFYRILSMCRRNSSSLGRFKLEDLLVVPFQRVLKYHLLLSNIHRYVVEDSVRSHQNKAILNKAIASMNDVNNYINEIKRDSDNLKLIEDIQQRICDYSQNCTDDLTEHGRILLNGRLKIKLHNQELKIRNVFLFEKAILICRGKGDKLVFKAIICLAQMRLEDNGVYDTGREKLYEFTIRDRDFLNISHKILCTSELEKSKWIGTLAKSLINLSSEYLSSSDHKHKFTYSNISHLGQRCSVCKRYLAGLLLQGFSCSLCLCHIHRDCIVSVPVCAAVIKPGCTKHTRPVMCSNNLAICGNLELPDLIQSTHKIDLNENQISSACTPKYKFQARCFSKTPNPIELRRSPSDKKRNCKPMNGQIHSSIGNYLRNSSDQRCVNFNKEQARLSTASNSDIEPIQFSKEIWYSNWSRKRAEKILKREDVPDNTFLVRPRESLQSNIRPGYSLSLKHSQLIYHIRIHCTDGKEPKYYLMDSLKFSTLQNLINYYTMNSLEDNFPPVRSPLVYPIHAVLRIYQ
ncbi:hypothetical protein GJ496_002605 [Pomphorhynchus laevis]|nr:hypothetical protein GJ496_002605 [Pomphorhynchus laevis]